MTFRSVQREHMLQLTPSYIVEDSAVSPHLLTGQGATFTLRDWELSVARIR